jgi:cyclic beta-1,2-glucan synthetase
MDFAFLYDPRRRLFSNGYDVEEGRLDGAFYDLLASEARLASFLAIAKGDVDPRHWFHLGRPMTRLGLDSALLSWGGSMFEYLMPMLFLRHDRDTLLGRSCRVATRWQIADGRRKRVCWGVSESACAARDLDRWHNYRSFGVLGLGLRTGLADELVIAPYATALALLVEPAAALANFRDLAAAGAEGPLGFYEAIDLTPRGPALGCGPALVRCYLANHQGMSFLALANVLLGCAQQRRFHSHPLVRAAEGLLHEHPAMASSSGHPPRASRAPDGWMSDVLDDPVRRLRPRRVEGPARATHHGPLAVD